jgi:hypothetical protein
MSSSDERWQANLRSVALTQVHTGCGRRHAEPPAMRSEDVRLIYSQSVYDSSQAF